MEWFFGGGGSCAGSRGLSQLIPPAISMIDYLFITPRQHFVYSGDIIDVSIVLDVEDERGIVMPMAASSKSTWATTEWVRTDCCLIRKPMTFSIHALHLCISLTAFRVFSRFVFLWSPLLHLPWHR